MILITSGDYIVDELRIEFGKIPPSFLPVGNLRLFIHQINALKSIDQDDIYISIPSSYSIKPNDLKNLYTLNVKIIYVPDSLSLGDSINHVLKQIPNKNQKLMILHGDTLILDIPLEKDFISISDENEQYNWEYDNENDSNKVWCGLFSFSKLEYFHFTLKSTNYNFIDSVKIYSKNTNLKRIISNDWSDFGHVVTYYKNRSKITTQRSFNTMHISDGIVKKSSLKENKIFAEIEWFLHLPNRLKLFSPQLIEYNINSPSFYKIEYLYLPSLSELFVFGEQKINFWRNIFYNCFNFLNTAVNNESMSDFDLNTSKSLIYDKTLNRLNDLNASGIWNINNSIILNDINYPSLVNVSNNLFKYAIDNNVLMGYLHGDFCFSNILYDIRSNRIKVIDPRGIDSNDTITQKGDIYYDYAKLTHSIIGCYDFIIAKMYHLEKIGNNHYIFEINLDNRLVEIQNEYFKILKLQNKNIKKIYAQMILLFISMIPLHKDNSDRQNALILNAYRLYNSFTNI